MKTGEVFHTSGRRRGLDLAVAVALSPLAVGAGSAAAVATMAANRSPRAFERDIFEVGGAEHSLRKMRAVPSGTIGRVATVMQRLGADEAFQIASILRRDSPLALAGIRPMTDEYADRHRQAAIDAGEPDLAHAWGGYRDRTLPGIFGPGRRFTHGNHPTFQRSAEAPDDEEAAKAVDRVLVGAMKEEVAFIEGLNVRRYVGEIAVATPRSLLGLATTGYAEENPLPRLDEELILVGEPYILEAA